MTSQHRQFPHGRNSVETVVLVDNDGTPIGTADKAEVHTTDTALHLAFSCHLRRADGSILVTRRALGKLTWPGVWTNSLCGHPAPGEDLEDALRRRAALELGIDPRQLTDVTLSDPDFRYRAVDASGIVENEICPVFTAQYDGEFTPNPDEVMEVAWVSPGDLAAAVRATPWAFSPWLVEQTARLDVYEGVPR